MRKKKTKKRILLGLAESLAKFHPELASSFLCPTCLQDYSLDDTDRITEGHIIPQAAGGRMFTYICKGCNDRFGRLQDKWFGEYLRLKQSPDPSILNSRIKGKDLNVAGVRVGGTYRKTADGIQFEVHPERTAPDALLRARALAADQTKPLEISFSVPLVINRHFIDIGFLTAAYLLWFRHLGYSWALQQHLDPIRKQIRNPRKAVVPRQFTGRIPGTEKNAAWIGVAEFAENTLLLAGFGGDVVLLPPVDDPELYDSLEDETINMELTQLRMLNLYQGHRFEGPIGVAMADRVLVLPDVFLRNEADAKILYIPADGRPPRFLFPITDEERKILESSADSEWINTKRHVLVADSSTGKPPAGVDS